MKNMFRSMLTTAFLLVLTTGCARNVTLQRELVQMSAPCVAISDSIATPGRVQTSKSSCEQEFRLKMAYIEKQPKLEEAKRGTYFPGYPGAPGYMPGNYPVGTFPAGYCQGCGTSQPYGGKVWH
jgi:hypothetical protein